MPLKSTRKQNYLIVWNSIHFFLLEFGRCPSWANPTWSNQIRDHGEVVSRSWKCQKLSKSHPNKKRKKNDLLSLSLLVFNEKIKTERTREEKFSKKKRQKAFVLWNKVVMDFSVVPFTTTWSEELNCEITIFFGSWVF